VLAHSNLAKWLLIVSWEHSQDLIAAASSWFDDAFLSLTTYELSELWVFRCMSKLETIGVVWWNAISTNALRKSKCRFQSERRANTSSLHNVSENVIQQLQQLWHQTSLTPADEACNQVGLEALSVSAWCIHFCNCISQKKIVVPKEHRSCWRRVKQQNYKFWKTVDMHTIEWRKILRGQFFCLKTLVTKFINFAHTSTLIDQQKTTLSLSLSHTHTHTCWVKDYIHKYAPNCKHTLVARAWDHRLLQGSAFTIVADGTSIWSINMYLSAAHSWAGWECPLMVWS
jgi:hypothetical protein